MENINIIVLKELHNFIKEYYNDQTLADYIFDIFSVKTDNLTKSEIPYQAFDKLLHYLQKMSGDEMICYNAGRFFSTKLLRNTRIPGIRLSIKGTFKKLDRLLADTFPVFNISIKSKMNNSLLLSLKSSDESFKISYYFSEYLRGILSALPNSFKLPSARVKTMAYPFSIEELLNSIDIIFINRDNAFFVAEEEIAREETKKGQNIQRISQDLFIRDVHIKDKTILKTNSLIFSVKWKTASILTGILFITLSFLGAVSSGFTIYTNMIYLYLSICLFLVYEMLLLLLFTTIRKGEMRKMYNIVERELREELSEQKVTTSEALKKTFSRLTSLEHLMEITKQIIHEKEIEHLFDDIRKLVAKALNADRTSVFLHDKENRLLMSGPVYSEEEQEFNLPEDKGIVGESFKLRKTVNVKDAYNNPNFDKSVDRITGYDTKSILCTPLIDQENDLVGMIEVLNKKEGNFDHLDEQLLETLSTFIATSLKDSLTISELQKRGIDPDMINGLNAITTHILDEYTVIQSTISILENPEIKEIKSSMQSISELLRKLVFLFDEKYISTTLRTTPNKIIKLCQTFLGENIGNKQITHDEHMNIPEDLELNFDVVLFYNAVYEIIINSIEAIEESGNIKIWTYRYVDIPRGIIHKYSLHKIVDEYNVYNEENDSEFLDYLKSKMPLLDSDLNAVTGPMKEYIALEIFDSGQDVKTETRNRIYNPFFSTKNHFGLGLSIAKTSLLRMGGMIDGPHSKEGGKSFRILIPRLGRDHVEDNGVEEITDISEEIKPIEDEQ